MTPSPLVGTSLRELEGQSLLITEGPNRLKLAAPMLGLDPGLCTSFKARGKELVRVTLQDWLVNPIGSRLTIGGTGYIETCQDAETGPCFWVVVENYGPEKRPTGTLRFWLMYPHGQGRTRDILDNDTTLDFGEQTVRLYDRFEERLWWSLLRIARMTDPSEQGREFEGFLARTTCFSTEIPVHGHVDQDGH